MLPVPPGVSVTVVPFAPVVVDTLNVAFGARPATANVVTEDGTVKVVVATVALAVCKKNTALGPKIAPSNAVPDWLVRYVAETIAPVGSLPCNT